MMIMETQMTLDRTLEDIYSYQKQALDLLDEDHPHYEEIKVLLTEQINDELGEIYANSKPDKGTGRL